VVAPDWLRAWVPPEWFDRDGPRMDTYRLPKTAAARAELAASIGADGRRLLQAVDAAPDLPWLCEVPAVQTLRQVWAEPYTDPPGPLRWREAHEMPPPADLIASPDDVEARYGTTRGLAWVGYQVHVTETCEDGQPHPMTHVLTTPATTPDGVMGPAVHDDWAPRDRLPSPHLLDGGDVEADRLGTAQAPQQLAVVGPTCGADRRQRRAGRGEDFSAFVIAGEAQQARGPQGKIHVQWPPGRDGSGAPVVRLRVETATCRACPVRRACPGATEAPRQRTVRPPAPQEALQAARQRQEPPAFQAQAARRAGIEGTPAPGGRRCGRRRTR
jgi:transposase